MSLLTTSLFIIIFIQHKHIGVYVLQSFLDENDHVFFNDKDVNVEIATVYVFMCHVYRGLMNKPFLVSLLILLLYLSPMFSICFYNFFNAIVLYCCH